MSRFILIIALFFIKPVFVQAATPVQQMKSAIIANNIQKVEKLLNEGFGVNTPGIRNWTPLIYAAYYGRYEIVKLLLARDADPNLRGKYGETALMEASCEGRGTSEMIELLIQSGSGVNLADHSGNTALIYASRSGHDHIVEILLGKKADPSLRNNYGINAMRAAGGGFFSRSPKSKKHQRIIELLKEHLKKKR